MSDIQPGDVVVCVDVRPHGTRYDASLARLTLGRAYRVVSVGPGTGCVRWAVRIDGATSSHPKGDWRASRFRKIRPADEQFIAQIRRRKPVFEDA